MITTLFLALGMFGTSAGSPDPVPVPPAPLPPGAVATLEGDTVDLVLWRHRGRTAALTEQTLELNPGLAARGAVLPAGVAILLPAPSAPLAVRETIKLWD